MSSPPANGGKTHWSFFVSPKGRFRPCPIDRDRTPRPAKPPPRATPSNTDSPASTPSSPTPTAPSTRASASTSSTPSSPPAPSSTTPSSASSTPPGTRRALGHPGFGGGNPVGALHDVQLYQQGAKRIALHKGPLPPREKVTMTGKNQGLFASGSPKALPWVL